MKKERHILYVCCMRVYTLIHIAHNAMFVHVRINAYSFISDTYSCTCRIILIVISRKIRENDEKKIKIPF